MSTGILTWGVYLPYWRLQRSAIGATLGGPSGRGTRSVASYDEDTTTMGVEAARRALAALDGPLPDELVFSTPAPAYLDKTNATAVHAAVGLPEWAGAYDLLGSVRSAAAALRVAEVQARTDGRRTLAVVADLRTGLAGGPEERDSGDGAAAFVFGPSDGAAPVAAELVAHAAASSEFLDRWRTPGETDSKVWEERFGQEVYVPLVEEATAGALKRAGLVATDIDHLAVAGLHVRAVQAAGKSLGVRPEAAVADRNAVVGNLGAAQAGLLLADTLEQAGPGELIALVVVADGADVFLVRTTDALPSLREARAAKGLATVADLAVAGRDDLPYARFLTWRDELVVRSCIAQQVDHTVEVGLHGQRLPGVRVPPPAAVAGVPAVPHHRRDGPGTHGRRRRAGGHLHGRPPGLQPVAPGGRCGGGLRRRWPVPLRDDRRRPRAVGDRHPGGDGLPHPVHGPRGQQLLLEGPPGGDTGRRCRRRRRRRGMSSNGIRDQVAIVGMGCTPFGERWDKGVNDLLVDAAKDTIASAGVTLDDIDAFWLGTMTSGTSGVTLSKPLKIDYKPVTRVENFCATGSEAFRNACYAVASGAYDLVMAIGVEKLKDTGYSGLTGIRPVGDGTDAALSSPAAFSFLAPAYAHRYGVDPEEMKQVMSRIAWKNHRNGAVNPRAQFRKEVAMETITRSPKVAGDLGVFDCSGVSDGSAAAIICRAEDAHRYTDHPLYVKALSFVAGPASGAGDPDYDYTTFPEVVRSAEDAYRQAGITDPRSQLAMAEVHDCFTPTELVLMEDFGFSERGLAWKDVLAGAFDRDGDLPVNPDGGLKSFGHPIGASGLRMLFECWLQLRGEAPPERQITTVGPGRSLGLTHNLGGAPGECVSFVAIVGPERSA